MHCDITRQIFFFVLTHVIEYTYINVYTTNKSNKKAITQTVCVIESSLNPWSNPTHWLRVEFYEYYKIEYKCIFHIILREMVGYQNTSPFTI